MLKKAELQIFYQRLGENIRSARDQQSIKQEALATQLGVTRISVSNIETGKQKIQLHSLVELADFLKTPMMDLIPSLDYIDREPSVKLEKKISKTEISNNAEAVEKVKDFIRLSTSNVTK